MNMTQEAVFTVVTNLQHTSVVLVKRKDVPVWTLPGGGINLQEAPESAAQRELFEETNLTAKFLFHITTYIPINRISQPTHLFITFFPESTLARYPFLDNSGESSEIEIFSIDKLPEMLFPIHRIWILEILSLSQKQDIELPVVRDMDEVSYSWLFKTLISHPAVVLTYIFSSLIRSYSAKIHKKKE